MERQQTDIIIAGGGVAGLTAACAFGTAGHRVLIVDPTAPVTARDSDGADLRTTAFLQPARAFLERAGLWDRLSDHAAALQVMRIVDVATTPPLARDFEAADIGDAPFGWNLPNWLLRREMLARIQELPNVTFRPGVGFANMLARTHEALVNLTDGSRWSAQLVIGADGRTSAVRSGAGIDVRTMRYGQKAVTFAVTHDAPHNNVSTEIHMSGGPFTLVPLPDHESKPCSAVVWMDQGANVQRLAALPIPEFEAEANTRSALQYGPLTLVTRRTLWPIISQVADRLTAPRMALVAEAAHVMPPIGAQGLNMSLKDLDCLLVLSERHELGGPQMLDAYARQRHPDIRLRVAGIDALNRASITGSPALQNWRAKGLQALHGMKPLRLSAMKMGLGAGERL